MADELRKRELNRKYQRDFRERHGKDALRKDMARRRLNTAAAQWVRENYPEVFERLRKEVERGQVN